MVQFVKNNNKVNANNQPFLSPTTLFLLLLLVFLLLCSSLPHSEAADTWPCLRKSDGSGFYCHASEKAPPDCVNPTDYKCPAPKCAEDSDCQFTKCDTVKNQCEDFPLPKPKQACAQGKNKADIDDNRSCGFGHICQAIAGGHNCQPSTNHFGTFRPCTSDAECAGGPPGETCDTIEFGVCVNKAKNQKTLMADNLQLVDPSTGNQIDCSQQAECPAGSVCLTNRCFDPTEPESTYPCKDRTGNKCFDDKTSCDGNEFGCPSHTFPILALITEKAPFAKNLLAFRCKDDKDCAFSRCLKGLGRCDAFPKPLKNDQCTDKKDTSCGFGKRCDDSTKPPTCAFSHRLGTYKLCKTTSDCRADAGEVCDNGVCLFPEDPTTKEPKFAPKFALGATVGGCLAENPLLQSECPEDLGICLRGFVQKGGSSPQCFSPFIKDNRPPKGPKGPPGGGGAGGTAGGPTGGGGTGGGGAGVPGIPGAGGGGGGRGGRGRGGRGRGRGTDESEEEEFEGEGEEYDEEGGFGFGPEGEGFAGGRRGGRPWTNRKGRPIPPQPDEPNCRDARNGNCKKYKELCEDKLYRPLMYEQCPEACGLCPPKKQRRARTNRIRRGLNTNDLIAPIDGDRPPFQFHFGGKNISVPSISVNSSEENIASEGEKYQLLPVLPPPPPLPAPPTTPSTSPTLVWHNFTEPMEKEATSEE